MKNVDPPKLELQSLLQQVAQRDEAAFASLIRHYNGRLSRYVSFKLSDAAEANDAVNDTLMSIWNRPYAYQFKSSFFTYLISIMERKVADTYRRRGRVLEDSREDYEQLAERRTQGNDNRLSVDPAWLVDQENTRKRFAHCRDQLSADQQAVLFWIFEMEATETEAAERCHCPVGTIKSRYAAARQAMKRCLTGWYHEVRHA